MPQPDGPSRVRNFAALHREIDPEESLNPAGKRFADVLELQENFVMRAQHAYLESCAGDCDACEEPIGSPTFLFTKASE